MKIGILTFPNTTSYGAVLQMYALYRAVEQLGGEPEIVNYLNSYMKKQRHTAAMQCGGLKRRLKLLVQNTIHAKQLRAFRQFEQKLCKYPAKAMERPEELRQVADRYDGVICGSDQVWNPDITGCDLSYFLDFCGTGTKRISYAPSFGIEEFSPQLRKKIEPYLKKFADLSVREKPGQMLIREITGREVPLVLDPTFLLQQQDWEQLEEPHNAGTGDYILYYRVRHSDSLLKFCMEKAQQQGLKVVYIGGNAFRQLKNRDKRLQYAYDLSPGQFLYLMHHARYVVTNSFHGTAFSIHYKKDFFLEMSSLTNSRLQQIITTAGLNNRVVGPDCDTMETSVDYDRVYHQLKPAKSLSAAYLKDAITE